MKNKREVIIAVLFLLIGVAGTYYFTQAHTVSKQIAQSSNKQAEQSQDKSSNNRIRDYLDTTDDLPMAGNKGAYYSLPDAKEQKTIPTDLKEFLVKNYYPNHSYFNPDIKINYDCSLETSDLKSTEVDLNGDGAREYIVMPWKICDTSMRGASGNGDILIVRHIDSTFEVIGTFNGNGYVISKKKTNGYSDILTNTHGSYATGTETLYRYQTFSNGMKTNGKYEPAFTKWYDVSRAEKSK